MQDERTEQHSTDKVDIFDVSAFENMSFFKRFFWLKG